MKKDHYYFPYIKLKSCESALNSNFITNYIKFLLIIMGWFESSSSSNRRHSNYQGGGGGGGATTCKKHPKYKKLQGICPSCLGEKLSKISKKNKTMNGEGDSLDSSSSLSSTSCYSSASNSSCSSPPYPYPIMFTGRRNSVSSTSTTKDGRLSFSINVKDGFTRSRSVALVARNWVDTDFAAVLKQEDHQNVQKKDEKKGGFWSKLLHKGSSNTSKRKQNKEHQVILMHRKTVKESTTIPYF